MWVYWRAAPCEEPPDWYCVPSQPPDRTCFLGLLDCRQCTFINSRVFVTKSTFDCSVFVLVRDPALGNNMDIFIF